MPTKSPRRKKRKATKDDNPRGNLERPTPPPAPPPELVNLIQSNSSVLKYFQSLQSNLDFDVQKWKTRAKQAQVTVAQLKDQLSKHQARNTTPRLEVTTPQKDISTSPMITTSPRGPPNKQSNAEESDEDDDDDFEIEIDFDSDDIHKKASRYHNETTLVQLSQQNALELASLSSDDDTDDGSSADSTHGRKTSTTPTSKRTSHSRTQENQHHLDAHLFSSDEEPARLRSERTETDDHCTIDQDWIKQQLMQAQSDLEALGVKLVQPETVTFSTAEPADETNLLNELKTGDSIQASATRIVRRSDQAVVVDLLYILRALVRVNQPCSEHNTHFSPFMGNSHVPCYMMIDGPQEASGIPLHPAAKGLTLAIRSLCLIDSFADELRANTDSPSQPGWESLWTGMNGRKHLVDQLVNTLEAEISGCWARKDRSLRLTATTQHFEPLMEPGSSEQNQEHHFVKRSNCTLLSGIMERCVMIRLVTSIFLHRQDFVRAFSCFWSYALSSSPVIGLEDYPKIPPLQSLCFIEAFLVSGPSTNSTTCCSLEDGSSFGEWMKAQIDPVLREALQLTFHATAMIFFSRQTSQNDKIANMALVESTAYQRLVKHAFFEGFDQSCTDLTEHETRVKDFVVRLTTLESIQDGRTSRTHRLALVLGLILEGNSASIETLLSSARRQPHVFNEVDRLLIYSCIQAQRVLDVRRQDTVTTNPARVDSLRSGELLREQVRLTTTSPECADDEQVQSLVSCCRATADADSALALLTWLVERSEQPVVADAIDRLRQFPTVRVINLERRSDRLRTFHTQAIEENVLFLRGVASLDERTAFFDTKGFAIDGKGDAVDAEQRLVEATGGSAEKLNRLVEPEWIPGNLRAFDSEAPLSDKHVRISSSEKACALSHIGTWRGILDTYTRQHGTPGNRCSYLKANGATTILTGLATGAPLLSENKDMDPAPVYIVLEDDAVLADRFSERLSALLEELPRDFHFCSIGYSRPRAAPLVPFSSQLRIPTSIWYLTGYILSHHGVEYLLGNLPVRGPVDTWIGLTMFSNWDNEYGRAVGVGFQSTGKLSQEKALSRKELRSILHFRAFAASTPLCHQVVNHKSSGMVRRSWRNRDTDIQYSGSNI